MRKHVSTITTVLVFPTGLSLLLYPTVSNYWNSKHQTQAVAEYSDRIEKMDEQEKKQAFEQAEKYNETLNFGSRAVLLRRRSRMSGIRVSWI